MASQTRKYPFMSVYFGNEDLIRRVGKIAKREKRSLSYVVCRAIKRDLRNNYTIKDAKKLDI